MREKSHYARYGNNVMQRVYCSECKCWALVLDHRKQCCDGWYNVESKITRVVVQPKHQRVLLPLYKKQAILNHQNNRCCYCGHQLGYYYVRHGKVIKSTTHFDHLIPFAYSQNNNKENFVASCNVCNSIKSSKMFDNIAELTQYIKSRIQEKKIEYV